MRTMRHRDPWGWVTNSKIYLKSKPVLYNAGDVNVRLALFALHKPSWAPLIYYSTFSTELPVWPKLEHFNSLVIWSTETPFPLTIAAMFLVLEPLQSRHYFLQRFCQIQSSIDEVVIQLINGKYHYIVLFESHFQRNPENIPSPD